MMEAKKFLNQLKKLDMQIENKQIEIQQWKALAERTTSFSESERVQTSGNQQKMADAIDRYVDIEKELNQFLDKLVAVKMDVIAVIEQLNAAEYDLLHKVYVQYITLEDVADMYMKSYSWATTLHGRALKSVQNILDERDQKDGKRN